MKYKKMLGKRSNDRCRPERKQRPVRTRRMLALAERQPVSPLPREMSAKILGNPKNKLTAKNRKRVMRSRYLTVFHPSVKLAVPLKDRIAAQVNGLTMGQLVRKTVQCPHRIQLAKSILADLSPDSRFAPDLRYNIAVNVFLLCEVEAEIARRTKGPAVRDTRTPRIRKQDAIKAVLTHTY